MQVIQELQNFSYIYTKEWLSITTTDEFQCFILPKMSYENVIVVVLWNMCIEAILQ